MSVIIDGYPIDLAVSETYHRESEASKSPQEKGADLTDHVRTGPRQITFDGIVSDTPIGAIAEHSTRTLLGEDAVPSRDAFLRLEELQDNPKLVTVECSLGKFENMLLVSLDVPRDATTTKGLKFSVTFEQITLAVNQRTTVRVAVPNGTGRANLGNKESQEWAASLGVKDAIFVISIPVSLSATWAKSFGPPLHRRKNVGSFFSGTDEAAGESANGKDYDCFQVLGSTQPDGFLTVNSSKKSSSKYTYHPLSDISSMGGTPTSNKRGLGAGSTTPIGTFINDRPVHYDYGDGTWKDDRDESVVKRVPKGDDRWKGVTVVDPKGHRQTY